MSVRGYTVGANWSRGPDYTGAVEDVSSYIEKNVNVVASWGRSDPFTSSDAAAGKLTYELINQTRIFSPENTSSPIHGRQTPGTPSKLSHNGVDLFIGEMDTIDVTTTGAGKRFAPEVTDVWTRQGDRQLSTSVYQGKRTGELIAVILDEIGWSASARSIDAGATYVPYWWAEGVSAKQAVDDLVHSEGEPAIAYVKSGVFHFRDRHHRLTRAASLTSQGTHTHIVPAGPIGTDHKILKGSFAYGHNLDRVINSATLEVTPRLPAPEAAIWSTTDPIVLSASEAQTIIVQADNPAINVLTPVANVDYVLAAGSVSFSLSRTSGQSFYLTITAGAGGASLNTGLSLRGTPLTEVPTRKLTAAVTGGQDGVAEWTDASAPWANVYDAQALTELKVATYSQPQPTVSFEIDGALGAGTMARIDAADVSDRITVRNDEIGLNADFHIEQVEHIVQQLGVRHTLRIGAQMAPASQAAVPFTFGVAGQGFNQGQFVAFAGNNPNTMFRFDTAGQGFNQGVFAT